MWHSWNVYLGGKAQFDRFVVEPLARLPVGADRWFFIRYGAGGPHLRVRLQTASPRLAAETEAYLRDHAKLMVAEGIDTEWLKSVSFPGAECREPGTVCVQPYEPETARYGGPHAIGISETLFCGSSRLAVRVLEAAQGSPVIPQALAIDMMLAIAASLFTMPAQAATFFDIYSRGWDHYLRELGRTVPDVTHLPPLDAAQVKARLMALAHAPGGPQAASLTGAWLRMLVATRDQLRALATDGQLDFVALHKSDSGQAPAQASIANILGSHMHMMNNRIGFSPVDELRWAAQLASALAAP